MSERLGDVLVVDDEAPHAKMLCGLVEDLGYGVASVANGALALERIARAAPRLVLLDMRMPVLDGLGTLRAMRERHLEIPTIVLTAHADVDDAVEAMKLGAADYLRKPIDLATLAHVLGERLGPASGAPAPDLPSGVVVQSPLMRDVLADLARVAASDAPLLLHGETGTGKDVLARLVHGWSPRVNAAFVSVNVAALPESLVESELFGHAKGAFTGADTARAGRLEEADGGTLFLDEIGEIPTASQPKFLRALQDGRVTRLGESRERTVDARLVTATNRDLEAAVRDGSFREDLYYRVAVVTIEVPPLRERTEDVLPLARTFLEAAGGAGRKRLGPAVEALLVAHAWPGNVRELEGAMRRAAILAPGDVILPEHLPPAVRAAGPTRRAEAENGDLTLAAVERRAIERALEATGGNRTEAARALGISRRKLLYRLKEYRDDSAE